MILQMVPQMWKREIETQFRMPGAVKTYDSLAAMLCALGDNERYNEMSKRDDMALDAANRAQHPELFNWNGGTGSGEEQYSRTQWDEYAEERTKSLGALRLQLKETEAEVDWLGKAGGKRGFKGNGKGQSRVRRRIERR